MRYLHAHSVSSHDVRYAYAVGRIRALEMRLLGKQRLDRLAEARDMEEALRLLADTVYAMHLEEVEESGYEAFIRNEERRLLDLVDSLSLDPETSDILRLIYDFHNLKVSVRERISGRDLGHLYVDLARFEPEIIRAALRSESIEALPGLLLGPASEAVEIYSKSHDLSLVDTIIDKHMYARFLTVATAYGSLFIEALVRAWIDLANVRIFLRARFLKMESRTLPELLIEGGSVRLTDFTEAFGLPLEEVLQRFTFSPYRRVIEQGGLGVEGEESFVPLERATDEHMVSFLRLARYFTFGLEVIVAYGLRKRNELRLLKLVLAAKDRGLGPEAIKERIGDVE
jgi:V/A-type H+-transporting ATPase subunit C